MMRSIACIGMAVADLVVGPVNQFHFDIDVTLIDKIQISPGGDAANVALNLAATTTPVSLYARLGEDMFGHFLQDLYRQRGIDISGINCSVTDTTATCITLVKPDGERVFLYHGGATQQLCPADIPRDSVMQHDHVHASGFFLLPGLEQGGLEQIFAHAQQAGKTTSLDVGWDTQQRWMTLIRPVLPHIDYFLPTENEARAITGKESIPEMASVLLDHGVKQVVIKMGRDGAYAHDGKTGRYLSGFTPQHVVDTSGAGDAFVAGFLAATARHIPFFDAVNIANAAGCLTVQHFGANGAITSFVQLENLAFPATANLTREI